MARFRVPQGFRFPEKRHANRHSLSAFRHACAVCPDSFPRRPDLNRPYKPPFRTQPGISSALSLFFASYACIIENMTAGSTAAAVALSKSMIWVTAPMQGPPVNSTRAACAANGYGLLQQSAARGKGAAAAIWRGLRERGRSSMAARGKGPRADRKEGPGSLWIDLPAHLGGRKRTRASPRGKEGTK